METPSHPQKKSPAPGEDREPEESASADRSRLEQTVVKSSLWQKQTLRDIELTRTLAANESGDMNTQIARMFVRLSAQLDERNDEIERLRRSVRQLEREKSELDRALRRELESHKAELEQLQSAYDQFEKESDSLLSQLGQQNEQLLAECRRSNVRSLLG